VSHIRASRCGISYLWIVRVEHGKRRPAWTGAISARAVARFFMALAMMGKLSLGVARTRKKRRMLVAQAPLYSRPPHPALFSLGTCGLHSRGKKPKGSRYSKHGTPSSRHLGRPTLGEKQAWTSYPIESERRLANERERAEPGDARIGSTPCTPRALIRWCGSALSRAANILGAGSDVGKCALCALRLIRDDRLAGNTTGVRAPCRGRLRVSL